MSLSIHKPLGEIFKSSDISVINIPMFQRPYSWPKVQIDQFLMDLDSAVENDSTHFYGLIVYVFNTEKQSKTIDIIDGQQRLTTAMINLAVIRDLMEDLNQNGSWSEDDELRNVDAISKIKQALKTKQECRLQSENESKLENQFLEIIQNSILDYSDKSKSPRKEYEEQKTGSKNRFKIKSDYLYNLGDKRVTRAKSSYKNYTIIHNFISQKLTGITSGNEEKFEFLIKYTDVLLDNFRYIPFQVESYDKAFEYFEVLNDRGLDISALDLIKNECIKKKLSEKQRKTVFENWSEIFAITLDETFNLIQFVRYAHMRDSGHITKRQIYKSYKEKIKNLNFNDLNDFLCKKLLVQAKIYKDLINTDTNLEPKFHNVIQLLKTTKTVQWYSIALAALEPLYNNKSISLKTKDKIVQLLESLHEVMFSLNYANVVANNIETKFPKIAESITFTNENAFTKSIEKALIEITKIKVSENLSFSSIDMSNSKNLMSSFEGNNDLGNMLVFLNKYYDKKSSEDKFTTGSLEHLFPQKPNESKWPLINKLNPEEIREMTYSLGNFFITNTTLNPSLGNRSFLDKRDVYKSWHLYDILPETHKLNYEKVKDWTPEIVKERSKWISESFEKRFK